MKIDVLYSRVLGKVPDWRKRVWTSVWNDLPAWIHLVLTGILEDDEKRRLKLQDRIDRVLQLCDLTEETQGRIVHNGNLACVPVAAIREQLGEDPFPDHFPHATHEQLLRVLPNRPSDFEPWGDRSDDERGGDCSCGCVWFHEIDGARGADWGVCFNPASPRAGLLTFEHQGCPQYDGGPDEEEDELG